MVRNTFMGKVCKRGHPGERYTSSRGCVECSKITSGAWAKKHPEKMAERSRASYLKHYIANRLRMAEQSKSEVAKNWFREYNRDPETWTQRACFRLRARAKKTGIPFNITPEDLGPIPAFCPFTLLPFDFTREGRGHNPQSPSVDKIKPERGYVRGNVRIISVRANMCKGDCTDPDVFQRLADDARLWSLI